MTVLEEQETEAVPLVQAEPASSNVEKGESGMVEVTAPMDLPEGYQLSVNVNNSQRSVKVPPGGVKAGETFKASASGSADVYSQIPSGDWRDGLCDCCRFGCCNAMCWLGWCCQPILSGQVMTRMSRDWFGGEGRRPSESKTCSIVVTIWIIVLVIDIILTNIQRSTYCFGGRTMFNFDTGVYYIECPDGSIEYPDQTFKIMARISNWIGFLFALYMLIAVCRTRANMRKKYQIRPGCCGGCEDCCCVFWCSCCTVQQMARHTHDYKEHPVGCCTGVCFNKRGQQEEIPEIENWVV